MIFREAVDRDLPQMLRMVRQAKDYMKGAGIDQWQKGYPDEAALREDINRRVSFVLEGEQGYAVGMISILFDEEPCYQQIDGAWMNDEPYASFHRICVEKDSKGQGIAGQLFAEGEKLCKSRNILNIRSDTHENNRSMRRAVIKNGFKDCGTIYLMDSQEAGDPRQAYQKILCDSSN